MKKSLFSAAFAIFAVVPAAAQDSAAWLASHADPKSDMRSLGGPSAAGDAFYWTRLEEEVERTSWDIQLKVDYLKRGDALDRRNARYRRRWAVARRLNRRGDRREAARKVVFLKPEYAKLHRLYRLYAEGVEDAVDLSGEPNWSMAEVRSVAAGRFLEAARFRSVRRQREREALGSLIRSF